VLWITRKFRTSRCNCEDSLHGYSVMPSGRRLLSGSRDRADLLQESQDVVVPVQLCGPSLSSEFGDIRSSVTRLTVSG